MKAMSLNENMFSHHKEAVALLRPKTADNFHQMCDTELDSPPRLGNGNLMIFVWHWVWWSNVMVQIRYAYAACYAYITLNNVTGTCIYDDVCAWYHEVNTIKGGSWSLFIKGYADLKLNTSVLFCLPQVNEHYWFEYLHSVLK